MQPTSLWTGTCIYPFPCSATDPVSRAPLSILHSFCEYGREANLQFQEEPAFQESTLGDAGTAESIASHVATRTVRIGSTLPSVLANVARAQGGQKRNFDERYATGIAKSQEPAKLKSEDWVRLKPDEHHMRKLSKGKIEAQTMLFKVVHVAKKYVRVVYRDWEMWDEQHDRVFKYTSGSESSGGAGPSSPLQE